MVRGWPRDLRKSLISDRFRYADKGLLKHYDGYFCLCTCTATDEGIFCSGGGVKPDGVTQVANFLGVFAQDAAGLWIGNLAAFNTTTPFADEFKLQTPGGPSNYTGVSQSLGSRSFVWRGYMSGVQCAYRLKCDRLCDGVSSYEAWSRSCP